MNIQMYSEFLAVLSQIFLALEGNIKDLGKYLGAGVAAIGFLGAGIGQGNAAGMAAEAVGRNPEAEQKIMKVLIVGAAIAESGAIYSLVVAIILCFVV